MSIDHFLSRFDHSQCSSDGMRIDAWNIAFEGFYDNYMLPSRQSYLKYYLSTPVGSETLAVCNVQFTNPHNFFLEQLFYGGILWFFFLCAFLLFFIKKHIGSVLMPFFIGFLTVLFFSPTYPQFYALFALSIFWVHMTDRMAFIK